MAAQSSPQIPFPDLPEGTVTFLFTDIEGSTKLLHRLRENYATLLADQRRILRETFANWNGYEVDTQGDAFFVAFSRATQAVGAAAEAQHKLTKHSWPEQVTVRVRMGIHTGEPWSGETGYVGMDVHRAARIAHVGHGGQVLLSETTTALVRDELPVGVSLADLGRHLLKDINRPERICQLVIEGLPAEFPPLTSLETLPPESTRLPRKVKTCPYKGLTAFQEADAQFYFGRETFVDALESAVTRKNLVAVIVGSSGSGKSSALFAGLLPRLRKTGQYLFASFRPGTQPFYSLADALVLLLEPNLKKTDHLAETGKLAEQLSQGKEVHLSQVLERIHKDSPGIHKVLLLVDQFEELYTLCPDSSLQKAFIDELLNTMEAAKARKNAFAVILLTMRADFMGQALAYRPFADALQEGSILMGPMTRQELHMAIEKPAEMQGAVFEPGLVERILDDVGEKPGNLPLLEFTLTQLWEQQTDGWLTHSNYEEMGGVEGALASYADQVYGGLEPEDQERARRALVQLVQPGEGTEDTRRIAARQELGEESWKLIQRLADHRLVVTGRDAVGNETAEVVHEALIQKWGHFQEWMDTDRAFRAWQEHLRGNLRQWQDSGQDEGALLAGAPLEAAQNWLAERESSISPAEAGYIQASLARQARQQMDRQHEADRLRRRAVWLSLSLGVSFILLLAAVLFARQSNQNLNAAQAASTQAISQRVAADAAGKNAAQQAQVAIARELAAASVNNLEVDQQRSILLAMQAVKTVDLPEAEAALHQAIQANRILDSFLASQDIDYGVAYSPDGKAFATASLDGTVKVWGLDQSGDKINQTALLSLPNPIDFHPEVDAVGYTIAFSPDGTHLAAISEKYTASIWEIPSGKLITTLEGHTGDVYSVAFSPDGKLLATASADMTIKLWDPTSGREVQTLSRHTDIPLLAVFSPDGKTLASGGIDGLAIIWKASESTSGQIMFNYDYSIVQPDDYVCSIAFSPDEDRLALGACSQIKIYDIASATTGSPPTLLLNIVAHVNSINSLYFNQAGDRLVSGSSDGKVIVWDATSGQKQFSLAGNSGSVTSISLSSNGERLLTAQGQIGTINLWDLSAAGNQEWFTAGQDQWRGHLSPDGKTLVSFSRILNKVGVTFWDLTASGLQEVRSMELDHDARISGYSTSPDFTRLVTTAIDQESGELSAKIWDLDTGQLKQDFSIGNSNSGSGHTSVVFSVQFSPDGNRLVTASDDGSVFLWDLSTGNVVQTFSGHTGPIRGLDFSPDGARLATSSWDGTARIWDVSSGSMVYVVNGKPLDTVTYSPDGRQLLIGSSDTTAILCDAQTGNEIRILSGHVSALTSVAFSPDGKTLATAALDGSAKIWNAATGQEVFTVPGYNVEFSPDGEHLITYDVFGVMRGFYLEVNDLMQAARAHLVRSWTLEECGKFLHADTCPPTP